MPLLKIQRSVPGAWGVWSAEESEAWFSSQLPAPDQCPDEVSHPKKRLEWLAGRFLVRYLYQSIALPYEGLCKDKYGKPFPVNGKGQVSLTNSFPLVAAQIHPDYPVGVDLEYISPRMHQVVPRVLSAGELMDAGFDDIKLCIYWCAKEAVFKRIGRHPVSLRKDISIAPFRMENHGFIEAEANDPLTDDLPVKVHLEYLLDSDHVLVLTRFPQ